MMSCQCSIGKPIEMQHRTRAIWILLFLACGFTVISFNLIQIQLVEHDKFWRHGDREPSRIPRRSRRSAARSSTATATSWPQTQRVYDIRLDGQLMKPTIPRSICRRSRRRSRCRPGALVAAFNPQQPLPASSPTDADDGMVARLRALKLDSLIFEPHDRAFYPNNELAAHVLGFVDDNGHGLAGMEKEMDKLLSGVPGERWVERDAKQHEIAGLPDPRDARRRRLQCNIDDQNGDPACGGGCNSTRSCRPTSPTRAYIIVMDPHTGEILAMGSRPTLRSERPQDLHSRTDDAQPLHHRHGRAGLDLQDHHAGRRAERRPGESRTRRFFARTAPFITAARTCATTSRNGMAAGGGSDGASRATSASPRSRSIICTRTSSTNTPPRSASASAPASSTSRANRPACCGPVSKWSALSITRIPMGQEVGATPIQMVDGDERDRQRRHAW